MNGILLQEAQVTGIKIDTPKFAQGFGPDLPLLIEQNH
jgi:hypothetical protein